jgi:parallel beta-helix repeat protein
MTEKIDFTVCVLAIFLLSTTVVVGSIDSASANFTSLPPLPMLPEPVYIRSDGVVEPSTAPLQRNGDIYTLTNNLNNTIEIQRSNTVLDGNGYTLTKPDFNASTIMMTPIGWLPGVRILGLNNVTIKNLRFSSCVTAVRVENSSNITVTQNTVNGAQGGLAVFSSWGVSILDNEITLASQSFATGINILPSNPKSPDSSNLTIKGNLIQGNAVEVPATPPQPDEYGIWGGYSNSQAIGNRFVKIKGIAMYYTGSNNVISFNSFLNNQRGLFFTGSQDLSKNNIIYGNSFDHNSENAVVPWISDSPINRWDNGTIGNYWSNYNGTDANGDGIGDTPYILETKYHNYTSGEDVTLQKGKDNFPLMNPIGEATGTPTVDYTPPVLHIIQPEKKTYEGSDVQLNFIVDEPVSWMGYCLDMATANITIDGNTTLSGLLTPSSHILQVFANDSMGNMGASETIGFVTTNPIVSPYPVGTPTQTAAPTTPPRTPPSPTQQQTTEPTFTPIVDYTINPTTLALAETALAIAIVANFVGLLAYFAKRRRMKQ